jgi:hypothetical protein
MRIDDEDEWTIPGWVKWFVILDACSMIGVIVAVILHWVGWL